MSYNLNLSQPATPSLAPLPFGGQTSEHLYLLNWIFGEEFDYTKFDFDYDMTKVNSILAPILNANNPDLSKMNKLGGKIECLQGALVS